MTNEHYLSYQESAPDASYVLVFFWYDPDPTYAASGVVLGRCDEDGGWRVGLYRKQAENAFTLTLFAVDDLEFGMREFERIATAIIRKDRFNLAFTGPMCRNGWKMK